MKVEPQPLKANGNKNKTESWLVMLHSIMVHTGN